MKKPELRERDIQKTILDYLELHHILHYRQNTGAVKRNGRMIRYGIPGLPDIVCVIGGRYVGIEVKAPGESPSLEQMQFGDSLEAAGGVYIVADCIEQFQHDIGKFLEGRL
jgi:hypothetical protein